MKILVTGGAGFIGSNLALELEKQGNKVIIIDNFFSGNEKNLKNFKGELIEKDISKKPIKGKFDIIFHEAAITDTTFPDDKEILRNNIEGFKNVLRAAIKNKAKLIYASSAAVYGNGKVPMKEEQKLQPLNAYAKSKVEMDKIAKKFFHKMCIIGLRYFNVYGPGEKFKGKSASMIYKLAKEMKNGKRPRIFKFGEQKRDFIYIRDVVDATIKAINAKSGIYNVGSGTSTTFNEMIKILNKVLGKNYETEYFNNPYKFFQKYTKANIEKAKKYLGFEARYSLEKGIREYMKKI